MIMDFLRSHNLTKSKVVRDSETRYWLRWYPSAPGALAYPHLHAFGHPVWEHDRQHFEGPGCQYHPLIWRPKRYPAPPGQHYHGLPSWFHHGLPADELAIEPIGDICGVPAIDPVGGVLIGGTAWPWIVQSSVRAGGVPLTANNVKPRIVTAPRAGGVPLTANNVKPRVRSFGCGCGVPFTETIFTVSIVSDVRAGAVPITANSVSPEETSSACGCGIPTTATSIPPEVTSEVFAGGVPASTETAKVRVISTACGCGLPVTVHYVGVRVISSACGCGFPVTANTVGPEVTSSACGCGFPNTKHYVGVKATSSACGCGFPNTKHYVGVKATSSACGCGLPVSKEYLGVKETSSACGCGLPVSTIAFPCNLYFLAGPTDVSGGDLTAIVSSSGDWLASGVWNLNAAPSDGAGVQIVGYCGSVSAAIVGYYPPGGYWRLFTYPTASILATYSSSLPLDEDISCSLQRVSAGEWKAVISSPTLGTFELSGTQTLPSEALTAVQWGGRSSDSPAGSVEVSDACVEG